MKPVVEFWSSTQYTGFMEAIMRELSHHGFSTRQRFQVSEASYRRNSGKISRLWVRFRQYVVYPAQLAWVLLRSRKADILVVCTNTFYAPRIASLFHPKVIFLLYDLFPEALIHNGSLAADSFLEKRIRGITRKSFSQSKATVFLGSFLKAYAREHYGLPFIHRTIPVGATGDEFPEPPSIERVPPTFLYSGNFGRMHETKTILGAFENWSQKSAFPDAFWRFQCSGPGYLKVEAVIASLPLEAGSRFTIGSSLPFSEWVETMKRADIALVTMRPGAETVVMPSKTYSALVAGQAVLAVAPEPSDLADLIRRHDCGWVVKPGDVEGFIETVEAIAANPEEVLRKRQNAYRAGHEHYSAKAVAKLWIELFEKLLLEDSHVSDQT